MTMLVISPCGDNSRQRPFLAVSSTDVSKTVRPMPEAEVTFVTVRFIYGSIALNARFADLPEQSAIPQTISSALTR